MRMSIQNRKIMSLCSLRLYGSGGGPRTAATSSGGSASFLGGIEGEVGAEDNVTFSCVEDGLLFVFVVFEAMMKALHKLKNKLI